jgi:hypothetical protein
MAYRWHGNPVISGHGCVHRHNEKGDDRDGCQRVFGRSRLAKPLEVAFAINLFSRLLLVCGAWANGKSGSPRRAETSEIHKRVLLIYFFSVLVSSLSDPGGAT